MSIKHVKNYYKQIRDQYAQMYVCLKEIEKEATEGLVDPDRVDAMQKSVQVLKDNYERWSYMMFLLYMPNKKDKAIKYKNQLDIDSHIPFKNSADGVIKENKEVLENFTQNKDALNLLGDGDEDD